MMNSRIPMTGLTARLSVVRKEAGKENGIIREAFSETILYEKVPGRVMNLRFFANNFLQQYGQGEDAAKLRIAAVKPNMIPNKILLGDYLRVYWGTIPNVVSHPDVPFNLGPEIWIETPEGPEKLTWSLCDGLYEGETINIYPDSDTWCIGGEVEHCFNPGQFVCQSFPEGYRFIRTSGPPVDYKIIRFNHLTDDFGKYHHTTLQIEVEDIDHSVNP
jgi:hypothetical protein